jgi:hypothetical protein
MKAKLIGKSKSAKSKTGLSFRYVISGTKEEIAELVKTENFKEYPQYEEATGLPLVFRNEPLLMNPCDVGISKNNRYYLDDTDVMVEMAMTEKMSKTSSIFAEKFAEKAVSKLSALSAFMDKVEIPETEESEPETKEKK